jgi:hypothetical protein
MDFHQNNSLVAQPLPVTVKPGSGEGKWRIDADKAQDRRF